MSEEDVKVSFGASIEGLIAGVTASKEQIEGMLAPINELREAFLGIGEAIAAAFAVEKFTEWAKSMAELGEQTARMADIFGTTTQEIGLLNFAAAETGGSGEALTKSLERLSVSLQQAGAHATPTGIAIKALGLDAAQLSKLPLPDLLDKLREKFSQLEPGMQRTAIAQALVRGGAESMLPILSMSNDKWDELRATFEGTGAAMTSTMAAAFAGTMEHITTFQTALTGLGERIFTFLEPAIDGLLDKLTSLVESLNSQTIAAAAIKIADTAAAITQSIGDMIISVLGDVSQLTAALQEAAREAGAAKDFFFSFNPNLSGADALKQKLADLSTMFEGSGALQTGIKSTKEQLADFDAFVKQTAAGIDNTLSGLGGMQHPAIVGDRADELRAKLGGGGPSLDFNPPGGGASSLASSDMTVLKANQALTKQILDDELANHQITMTEWATQTKASVDEEYQAQVAELQKESAIGGLKLAQRKEILNKLQVLEDQHAQEIEKINQKVYQDTVKSWTGALDTITGAFNSQISGLLKGTESWGTALKNVLLDFTTKGIEWLEKMAVQWIANEAAKTTATTTGIATRTAAEQTGSAASMAAQMATALSTISRDAAEAFAGTVAFLSPTMGPAALGVAAGVETSVLASGAGLASFAVGTWGLPSDSPIMAHQGEMIAPKFESGKIRAMADAFEAGNLGRGGGDVHQHTWNVTATDPRSFIQMLNDHSSPLAKAVRDAFNKNPSLRPSY